jgi:hypothetical protein
MQLLIPVPRPGAAAVSTEAQVAVSAPLSPPARQRTCRTAPAHVRRLDRLAALDPANSRPLPANHRRAFIETFHLDAFGLAFISDLAE